MPAMPAAGPGDTAGPVLMADEPSPDAGDVVLPAMSERVVVGIDDTASATSNDWPIFSSMRNGRPFYTGNRFGPPAAIKRPSPCFEAWNAICVDA